MVHEPDSEPGPTSGQRHEARRPHQLERVQGVPQTARPRLTTVGRRKCPVKAQRSDGDYWRWRVGVSPGGAQGRWVHPYEGQPVTILRLTAAVTSSVVRKVPVTSTS